MKQSKDRVFPDHSGTCVLHDRPNPLPHFGPVAMNGAVGAGGLAFPKRAFLESFLGISLQIPANGAEFSATAVAVSAVHPDHGLDGFSFPGDPGVGFCHVDNIMRPAPDEKEFPNRTRPLNKQTMLFFV
jgi:hypothetical protein